jgi:hypothetical protein
MQAAGGGQMARAPKERKTIIAGFGEALLELV